MGRVVKDTKLDSRESRLKLKETREPYWRLIHQGLHLGYRKGPHGGVWLIRRWYESKYIKRVIGRADDLQDSDGQKILSFREAQMLAITFTSPQYSAKRLTIADIAKYYMEWFKEHRKSYTTTQTAINAHILPALGKKLVIDLKSVEIRKWHEKIAETPARERTAKGAEQKFKNTPQTDDAKRARRASANRMLTILKAILNKAYQDELVQDDSPWRRVRPFKNTDEPVIRFLSEEEAKRLISVCPEDFRPLVKAALFTGARYGELVSLQWEDVNFLQGKVFIRPGKSGRGRHVPLSAEGIDFFKKLSRDARQERVFIRENGTPWQRDYQRRPMLIASNKAEISPSIGFHDLRHTYASLLAQRGADLLTISKLLGHADTRVTSRHYAHLCDKTLADAVDRFLPKFGHEKDLAVVQMVAKKKK